MSGYISLNRTGFLPFDDALSLIEDAGDAYYHTSQWVDDGWNGEKPYMEQINESIEFAAGKYCDVSEEITTLRARVAELEKERDAAIAEAVKAENAAIVRRLEIMHEDMKGQHNYYLVAANVIRAISNKENKT